MQAVKDSKMTGAIARNVKRLLLEREMTQSDLARATGLSFNFISDVCTEEHMPNVGALVKIAKALDSSLDRIISDPAKPHRSSV